MINALLPDIINKRLLFGLLGAFFVLWVLPIPAGPLYVVLALHALRGPRQTIEAIALMFLLLMSNGAVLPGGSKSMRWLVLLAGFVRALWEVLQGYRLPRGSTTLQWLVLFFLLMLPLTWVSSKIPLISVLKLVSFFAGTVALLVSFMRTASLSAYWQSWFTTYFVFIIGASLLIFLAGIGYERNGMGFQGVFGHPQLLGPIMGTVAAWLWGLYMMRGERSLLILGSGILALFFLYISQARTGALAIGAGFIVTYLIFFLRGRTISFDRRSRGILSILLVGLVFYSVLRTEELQTLIISFTQKRTYQADVSGLVLESRGALIQKSMDNFHRNPVLGIGLGVPSEYDFGNNAAGQETFLGLPLSASVEKGFLPTAVLEEMGLIGAFFTLVFIFSIITTVVREGSFINLWFVWCVFLINIGEAVFYSLGGMGLYVWIMLGLCINQGITVVLKKTLPLSEVT